MRVIIATFPDRGSAERYSKALGSQFGVDEQSVSMATAGAYGQPHDGHPLVAAWVPPHLESDIRELAARNGGTLHEPPRRAEAPRSTAQDQSAPAGSDGNEPHRERGQSTG